MAPLYSNESLRRALNLLEASFEDHLPVLKSKDDPRIVGVLHHRDLLLAYNQALLEERREEHGEA